MLHEKVVFKQYRYDSTRFIFPWYFAFLKLLFFVFFFVCHELFKYWFQHQVILLGWWFELSLTEYVERDECVAYCVHVPGFFSKSSKVLFMRLRCDGRFTRFIQSNFSPYILVLSNTIWYIRSQCFHACLCLESDWICFKDVLFCVVLCPPWKLMVSESNIDEVQLYLHEWCLRSQHVSLQLVEEKTNIAPLHIQMMRMKKERTCSQHFYNGKWSMHKVTYFILCKTYTPFLESRDEKKR